MEKSNNSYNIVKNQSKCLTNIRKAYSESDPKHRCFVDKGLESYQLAGLKKINLVALRQLNDYARMNLIIYKRKDISRGAFLRNLNVLYSIVDMPKDIKKYSKMLTNEIIIYIDDLVGKYSNLSLSENLKHDGKMLNNRFILFPDNMRDMLIVLLENKSIREQDYSNYMLWVDRFECMISGTEQEFCVEDDKNILGKIEKVESVKPVETSHGTEVLKDINSMILVYGENVRNYAIDSPEAIRAVFGKVPPQMPINADFVKVLVPVFSTMVDTLKRIGVFNDGMHKHYMKLFADLTELFNPKVMSLEHLGDELIAFYKNKDNHGKEMLPYYKEMIPLTVVSMADYDTLINRLSYLKGYTEKNDHSICALQVHNICRVQPWFDYKQSRLLIDSYVMFNLRILLDLYFNGAHISDSMLRAINTMADTNRHPAYSQTDYILAYYCVARNIKRIAFCKKSAEELIERSKLIIKNELPLYYDCLFHKTINEDNGYQTNLEMLDKLLEFEFITPLMHEKYLVKMARKLSNQIGS